MYFMMLPLWTIVTLFLFWSSANWIAARTRRSVPSRLTGLMPRPAVPGKRIFAYSFGNSFSRKARSFFAPALSASSSMPA